MRLPRPRVTLWVLMVVVALTAIGSGVWVLRERAREYRKKADQYAKLEQEELQFMEVEKRGLRIEERYEPFVEQDEEFVEQSKKFVAETRDAIAGYEATAAYYAALEAKYRRASSRPWMALSPDPPPPTASDRVRYWLSRHDYPRALAELDALIETDPDVPYAYQLKAWMLATCPKGEHRDGRQAVEAATRACELRKRADPDFLDTLAAAYAEAGDFEAAIRWQTEALERQAPNSPKRPGVKARLTLYQQGKPYREEPKAE